MTSCECERNASVVCRLHNFMRAGMTESRLKSLALMHIHYQHHVDLDTVVQMFASTKNAAYKHYFDSDCFFNFCKCYVTYVSGFDALRENGTVFISGCH